MLRGSTSNNSEYVPTIERHPLLNNPLNIFERYENTENSPQTSMSIQDFRDNSNIQSSPSTADILFTPILANQIGLELNNEIPVSEEISLPLNRLGLSNSPSFSLSKRSNWLNFEIQTADGENFEENHEINNVLRDDFSVFSSRVKTNVDIKLTHITEISPVKYCSFSLSEIYIRVPTLKSMSPLRDGFIFTCSRPVSAAVLNPFGAIDTRCFLRSENGQLGFTLPPISASVKNILYFQLDYNNSNFSYKFQTPVTDVKVIYIKMLNNLGLQDSIDVEFFGFKGTIGMLSFPSGYIL